MAIRSRLLHAIPAALVLLGCAIARPSAPASTPTATPPPEPVELDLCSLLTEGEVSDALGEAVAVQPDLQTGACNFATTAGPQAKSVSVSAAQGHQARQLLQRSASLGLLFGGDPAAQQIADELKNNADSMSLEEVLEKANLLLAPLGYTYSAFGPADIPAVWGWNPLGAGSMQQVRGETYLAVSVVGLEEEAAQSTAESLITLARGRLLAAFTIEMGESLRVEFTISPPTPEPEPSATPKPASNMTLWVSDRAAGRVARIDAVTGEILADIRVGTNPLSIAVDEDAVWVGNEGDGTVSRIDPVTNQVVATIPIGKRGFLRLASGEGRVWVAACLDRAVVVIDPSTNTVVNSIPAEGCWNVAVGGGAVWVPVGERSILRIDPETLVAVPAVYVQSGPSEIASGFGSMWVANVNAMTISRFDPETRQVIATLSTDLDHAQHGLLGLATGEGRVWLATTDGIQGFDPGSDALVLTFHAVPDPQFMTVANGLLWVTTTGPDGVVGLNPITGAVVWRVAWGVSPMGIAAGP
ncbi:MAG TPA: hypothetical protein VFI11_03825 [Anaerolineales bacterium]|nr:hypothetical protein [Anaerolineales bacterium]